jgi:4-hydroxythreonine-4-phosphate dehydrogenase
VNIGICLGDLTGIGPEVTLKALASDPPSAEFRYLLFGDAPHLAELNHRLGTNLLLQPAGETCSDARFRVCDSGGEEPLPPNLESGSPLAARAAVRWVREAAQACVKGDLQAMVTAPVNKEAIVRSGQPFVGQTEFLTELSAARRTAMMLLGTDDQGRWLRVTLATTHLPLKSVSDHLSIHKVQVAIELAAQACRDLGLPRARVGVCGLNPHAGEGGQLGSEESSVIEPAVRAARQTGVDAVGPLSADALFYYAYRGQYDVVVAMYHDQGLAPLKMIAFDSGVNWTLGLPFVRTSPDHGTAYDIAGKGVANPSSMAAAINLAKRLAARG